MFKLALAAALALLPAALAAPAAACNATPLDGTFWITQHVVSVVPITDFKVGQTITATIVVRIPQVYLSMGYM